MDARAGLPCPAVEKEYADLVNLLGVTENGTTFPSGTCYQSMQYLKDLQRSLTCDDANFEHAFMDTAFKRSDASLKRKTRPAVRTASTHYFQQASVRSTQLEEQPSVHKKMKRIDRASSSIDDSKLLYDLVPSCSSHCDILLMHGNVF